jgi:hypothetical protein
LSIHFLHGYLRRVDINFTCGYGGCHAFGVTGDAVRVGDMKLLVTYNGSAPWGDSSPPGVAQHAAFGFRPPANDSIPTPFRGAYFLFNISADPTESTNLAEARPAELAALLDFLEAYKATAIAGLNWRWGFHDPMWLNNGGCQGPFNGSLYCSYGHERGCFVHGTGLGGPDIGIAGGTSPEMCQAACAANARWFSTVSKNRASGVLSAIILTPRNSIQQEISWSVPKQSKWRRRAQWSLQLLPS